MIQTAKKIMFVMGVVIFFLPSILPAASPPAGVNKVLLAMKTFDQSYVAGKWEEASAAIEKIEKMISEIFVEAQLDDFILEENLADLKKNVADENVSRSEDSYIAVQKQYFNFISHFDHDVHPILARIEYYVTTGAPEALASNDYDDFQWNVKMAGILVDHGKVVLMNKGISEQEINKFTARVSAVNLAAKKGDTTQTGKLFEQLKSEYISFMSRYTKK